MNAIRIAKGYVAVLKLWVVLAILFLLHGTIGALAISRFERIPLIWYVPVDAAEIAFFIYAIDWAFAKGEAHQA